MKKRHYLLTAVIAYFVFLIATVPAKPVIDLVNGNRPVTIQGVSGTLWNGKAYIVSFENIQLKKTEWSFNLWKLFIGSIAIDISSRFSGNDIVAQLGTSFTGRYFINDLSAKISAPKVAEIANIPMAQLDGMISLNIEHAQWKQGELPLATGEIKWTDATITVADTASLGNITISLNETDELLTADINNKGGDIKITGTAGLVPEADYTVDIKLLPTATANNNIKQSLGMFTQKQANGEYTLKKTGSLNQIL
jgi:general secretion pathway protein N